MPRRVIAGIPDFPFNFRLIIITERRRPRRRRRARAVIAARSAPERLFHSAHEPAKGNGIMKHV